MDDILSNFSFKLQPKENGKSPIEYIVYCIDKKYYMVEKITDKSLFFYNKTIIKKFINKLYKSYYFKNIFFILFFFYSYDNMYSTRETSFKYRTVGFELTDVWGSDKQFLYFLMPR